ncbi:hypothetical protein SAMN02745181_2736 [Rubritalea squalenifaciens DSM 18772]|uniref:Uncharacterized protein n=2 Tax=Rubritalea TaxID=361050 RepID=A0A1M6MHN8_9BACT|nr:hypothetical protein [Rubritalea squalenifaciens]SHJ82968.1 hypothetical protein SAMN02745181_2736 [Rubritalea squalenifaciens DSM 18772]
MSLRTQLNEVLPEILPANPKEAIKGTELIRLVRMRLNGNYSDASLRYHFSIMSCDPGSSIAKVDKGQGYYRRTAPVPALSGAQELLSLTQGRLDDLSGDQSTVDQALMRVKKFRAIVHRWCEVNGRFPFVFREPFQQDAPMGNLWKFPELVMVDWEGAGEDDDESAILQLKKNLSLPPFRLHAARLRIFPSHHSFREDFFQALSASVWANGGELIYAAPIEDEALTEAYRKLNAAFGVGVTSFGLNPYAIDDLPRPAHILNAHPRETEALMERLEISRIAAAHSKPHIDWNALEAIRNDSSEVDALFSWLNESLVTGKRKPYETV